VQKTVHIVPNNYISQYFGLYFHPTDKITYSCRTSYYSEYATRPSTLANKK